MSAPAIPKDEPLYPALLDELRLGNAIPFLGAGASRVGFQEGGPKFLPTGSELANQLADYANFPLSEMGDRGDLSKMSSYLVDAPITMAGPNKLVDGFCLSPNGGWVLTASTDKTMGIMKRGGDYILAASMNDAKVLSCAFAGANRVVAGDSAGHVHVHSVELPAKP